MFFWTQFTLLDLFSTSLPSKSFEDRWSGETRQTGGSKKKDKSIHIIYLGANLICILFRGRGYLDSRKGVTSEISGDNDLRTYFSPLLKILKLDNIFWTQVYLSWVISFSLWKWPPLPPYQPKVLNFPCSQNKRSRFRCEIIFNQVCQTKEK